MVQEATGSHGYRQTDKASLRGGHIMRVAELREKKSILLALQT